MALAIAPHAGVSKERTFESSFVITLREPRRTPKAGKPQSLKHKKGESTSQANREQLPSQDELTTQAELPIEPYPGTSERLTRSPYTQPHVQEVRPAPKRIRSEAHKKAQREKQAKLRAERNSLVVHQFWIDGYRDFNLMRASAVVKRQSTRIASWLR